MRVGFISLGCCKNRVDSENIMGVVRSIGHEIVNDAQNAQVIIINTCGFIASAKEESINTILEMAEYKNHNCQKLIVTGCLAQRYKDDLINELPEVDRFITIDEYPHLAEILTELIGGSLLAKSERVLSTEKWFAYEKIADGCSNRCTYCAIPLIRHDYVSYDFADLINEAKSLAAQGVKELNLIAQDTTRYGIEKYGHHRLLELLQEMNKIEDLHWIRVLYMYPDEISEELVLGMKKLDKVLPYFDIPLQHGNDKMLELMNRRGKIAEVKHIIKFIRENISNAVIRTTMIVGFPGESEQDFNDLLEFVKEIKFDRLGGFTYSLEEDTVAYNMDNQIDEDVKEQRLAELMMLQEKIAQANGNKLVNKELEVLIEGYNGLINCYTGRSVYSAPDGIDGTVFIKSNEKHQFGEFVKVIVDEAKIHDLYAHEQ